MAQEFQRYERIINGEIYVFTKHLQKQMLEREIAEEDILYAIHNGVMKQINEEKFQLRAFFRKRKGLDIVVGIADSSIWGGGRKWILTAYLTRSTRK